MTAFFAEYGLFLLKVATIVVAIVVVIGFAAATGRKATHEGLEVDSINKKYKSQAKTLQQEIQVAGQDLATSRHAEERTQKRTQGREKTRQGQRQAGYIAAAQFRHRLQR
jgi:serine protease SohB